jgi:hypothetical protein
VGVIVMEMDVVAVARRLIDVLDKSLQIAIGICNPLSRLLDVGGQVIVTGGPSLVGPGPKRLGVITVVLDPMRQ